MIFENNKIFQHQEKQHITSFQKAQEKQRVTLGMGTGINLIESSATKLEPIRNAVGHFSLRGNSATNRALLAKPKPPTTLNPLFFSTHQADREYGSTSSLPMTSQAGTHYTATHFDHSATRASGPANAIPCKSPLDQRTDLGEMTSVKDSGNYGLI